MTRSLGPAGGSRYRAGVLVAGTLVALGSAGCGTKTAAPAPSRPSWATSLGPGITVVAPGDGQAAGTAPGALVTAYVAAVNSSKVSEFCAFFEPAAQPACRHAVAHVTSTGGATISHFAVGYVAIDGNRALVGMTGSNCNPNETPRCDTNTDPAALFSSGRTFATLYRQAVASQNSDTTANTYSLAPCVRVGSQWYLDVPPSDFQ